MRSPSCCTCVSNGDPNSGGALWLSSRGSGGNCPGIDESSVGYMGDIGGDADLRWGSRPIPGSALDSSSSEESNAADPHARTPCRLREPAMQELEEESEAVKDLGSR